MTRHQVLVSAGLCRICGREIAAWGYPAMPITRGQCCDNCLPLVEERRMQDMASTVARDERIEQIVAARAAGMTPRAIGQQFGVSPARIRQILRRAADEAAHRKRHATLAALAAGGDHEAVLTSPSAAPFFPGRGADARIQEALRGDGLDTIGKIAATTRAELLRIPNLGRRSVATLTGVLADIGITLQGER